MAPNFPAVELNTAAERALPQTPTDVKLQKDDATTMTQENSKVAVPSSNDKAIKTVIPLQLPEQNSFTTHRSVTPVLTTLEKTSVWGSLSEREQSSELYSPMSSQFLVPPDYEAIFSGHQTLRVSESSKAPLNDSCPVSPVSSHHVETDGFITGASEKADDLPSEDFKRSELESKDPKFLPKDFGKGPESPQHSDSESEFFDCRQALSDFSDPEDLTALEHDVKYRISEPPSPIPGSSPNISFLRASPQKRTHPYLRVEDWKHFSSGSESLGDFAYDSEGSRECQTEGDLPVCEELPSRDQAGYYDDDDFLGRVRG